MTAIHAFRRILVVEPQCRGFEHVPFNAALLDTVGRAFSGARIWFHGENQHIEGVGATLGWHGRAREEIVLVATEVPPRDLVGWRRLWPEFQCLSRWRHVIRDVGADLVIFSSITDTGLIALKCALWARLTHTPVLAVVHGALETVLTEPPSQVWNRATSMTSALSLPNPRQLRYMALGDSIVLALLGWRKAIAKQFLAIDHPYLFPPAAFSQARAHGPCRFGFFGVSSKPGFVDFAQLARSVSGDQPEAEFLLVGHIKQPVGVHSLPGIAAPATEPLTANEYARLASRLTFAIGLAGPESYRLSASASFLDSLAYATPGIFVRNPYVECYFERMGDIGYLCRSGEEVETVVRGILERFPTERYERQRQRILEKRDLFAPTNVAPHLGAQVGCWLQGQPEQDGSGRFGSKHP